jgi:hypothetical protein
MNTKAIAISVAAGIAVLLLSFLVDRLNRWTAKRRVAKLIEDQRSGKLKEVDLERPKHGIIQIDDNRIAVIREGKPIDSVLWQRISEISAYKRDLFSVDLICVGIKAQDDGQFLEVHEEMKGFKIFMSTLSTLFTFRDRDWWSKMAFPAFETNLTILWKTGDPTLC